MLLLMLCPCITHAGFLAATVLSAATRNSSTNSCHHLFFCTLAVCPLESPAQTSSTSIKGQQWAGLKLRLDRCALPQQKVPWSGDQAKEAAGMSICKIDLTFQSCCFGGKSRCTSGSPERHLIGRTTFSPCWQHQQHPASQNAPAHKLTC